MKMKKKLTFWVAVSLHGILFSQTTPQEPQNSGEPQVMVSDTLDPMMVLDSAHHLGEVVVSANRFEQQRKNIPQSTEVIRAESMAFDNLQTSADVIQNTGNILVQKSQLGGGSPIIRGFETNKVLLVIDGVRMNNAIYRAGHLQNIITLDNAAMDKIEILYGPGSVMYGSDALGGVMHFFTKDPVLGLDGSNVKHGSAFARYSTADEEITAHLDFSIGGSKWGSLTSFTYSDFGDLTQGANRSDEYPDFGKRPFYVEQENGEDVTIVNPDPEVQVGSAYTQYDILQKFVYRASDAVTHKLNLQYSTSSDVPRYDRLTQLSPSGSGDPRYSEWYYGPQDRIARCL
jgi:hemoglobin/transferrin/lactoferrin receptor protein